MRQTSANMLKRSNSSGFSLVEITLAVGIVSVGILTMLGITPIGLNTMREAMDATVRTQIVQTIASEAMVIPFSQLQDLTKSSHYFDGDGLAQAQRDANSRFEVHITQEEAVYPGSAKASDLDASVTTLRVEVRLLPANRTGSHHVLVVPNRGG